MREDYPFRLFLAGEQSVWTSEYVQNNFEEQPNGHEDPTRGWSRVASAIEVQMVPGGHLACVSTHVKVLADQMKACLDKADATKSKLSG
jgi:thioesterase domain-containing protein